MSARDVALLVLAAAASIVATAVFAMRRRRGSSHALATFAATVAFGGAFAVAFLLQYDAFFSPRASIGLERIVTPIMTMVASLIGASLLAGLVHVIGGRAPRGPQTVAVDTQALLDAATRRRTERRAPATHAAGDWRAFAQQAADATTPRA